MNRKNIILIGFMASGKSSIARYLSEKLGRLTISTDEKIEAKEGKSITMIFKDKGEAYFRRKEKQVLKELSYKSDVIIDCGGGVVKDSDNVKILKNNGVVFWITVDPAIVLKRIKKQGGKRPLLDVSDPLAEIIELQKIRQPYYQEASDYIIDGNDDDVADAAKKIIHIISQL